VAVLLLAGCATGGSVGDHLPAAVGGLPESAPERPAAPMAYPDVHDMPPARPSTTLSDREQKQLETDLIAARKRLGGDPATTGTTRKPAAGDTRDP
jgi:hypothetical protein